VERSEIGKRGETLAAGYLSRLGYVIRERNFHSRRGEIDLVALDGEELVFVEVRYRSSSGHGSPLETVDLRKRRKIVSAARFYLIRRGVGDVPCRFDVIALSPEKGGTVRVEHHRNAFDRDGRPFG